MDARLISVFVSQLDLLLATGQQLDARKGFNDWSDGDIPRTPEVQAFVTQCRAAVERITPPGSPYRASAEEAIKARSNSVRLQGQSLYGILKGLRNDLAAGYLESATELIHASMFADFLEMAEHLVGEGYKDAAAVIAGSSLEAHLRNLCTKNSIALDTPPGSGKPKKADTMNGELGTANVYTKLDQKSVTSWLGLRNKAAHGKYAEYTQPQVELLIAGIRDFINRNPA